MSRAFQLLEAELPPSADWLFGSRPHQVDVTIAVVWSFNRLMLGETIAHADYPRLCRFAEKAERLPEFETTPLQ